MKRIMFGILSVALLASMNSCEIINPDEPLPQYITIDSFEIQSYDPSYHGSVSQKITDAWVYVNNHNVGNLPLPAKVPIIIDGEDSATVSIHAGIKDDGRSFSRRRYPFYTPYSLLVAKDPVTTKPIKPVIRYRDSLDIKINETFENGNSFSNYSTADTGLSRTNDAQFVYEGANAGVLYLDGTRRDAYVSTVQDFIFANEREAYLEMDYKCDIPFTVEMQVITGSNAVVVIELLGINIKKEWNKIYIKLNQIGENYPGRKVKILLKTGLTPGQTSGFVAIDNFKIISQ